MKQGNAYVEVYLIGSLIKKIDNEVLHQPIPKAMWEILITTYSQAKNQIKNFTTPS